MTTRQRLVVLAALALAGVGFTLAIITAADPETDVTVSGAPPGQGPSESAPIVERYIPARGDDVRVQQADVGLDLSPGYAATGFTLNDVAIPDDELEVVPETAVYTYRPAEGKAVEAYRPQINCATAQVYLQADGPGSSRTERWCFEVF